MRRVENKLRLRSITVICEVINVLRDLWPENLEAIVQGLAVVLVLIHRWPQFFQDLLRTLFIPWLRLTQIRHSHVWAHSHVHVRHLVIGRCRLRIGTVVVLHFAHIHSGHIRFRRRVLDLVLFLSLILLSASPRNEQPRQYCREHNHPMDLFHLFSLVAIIAIKHFGTNYFSALCNLLATMGLATSTRSRSSSLHEPMERPDSLLLLSLGLLQDSARLCYC